MLYMQKKLPGKENLIQKIPLSFSSSEGLAKFLQSIGQDSSFTSDQHHWKWKIKRPFHTKRWDCEEESPTLRVCGQCYKTIFCSIWSWQWSFTEDCCPSLRLFLRRGFDFGHWESLEFVLVLRESQATKRSAAGPGTEGLNDIQTCSSYV